MKYPTTEDGRYFIHRERLWRCTNPSLTEDERSRLVQELMVARRAVNTAKKSGNADELRHARKQVNEAKMSSRYSTVPPNQRSNHASVIHLATPQDTRPPGIKTQLNARPAPPLPPPRRTPNRGHNNPTHRQISVSAGRCHINLHKGWGAQWHPKSAQNHSPKIVLDRPQLG